MHEQTRTWPQVPPTVIVVGSPTDPTSTDDLWEAAMTEMTRLTWYSTEELAELLGIDPSSLRRWRTCIPLHGPAFVRVSPRKVIYKVEDVNAWLDSNRTDPQATA